MRFYLNPFIVLTKGFNRTFVLSYTDTMSKRSERNRCPRCDYKKQAQGNNWFCPRCGWNSKGKKPNKFKLNDKMSDGWDLEKFRSGKFKGRNRK